MPVTTSLNTDNAPQVSAADSPEGFRDPNIVIQNLLYKYPLYHAMPEPDGFLNVLVIGARSFSQKFLDFSMQAAQMKGYFLRLTVLSEEPEQDRLRYLKERPDLTRFVDVTAGGAPSENPDTSWYALVHFCRPADLCGEDFSGVTAFTRKKADNDALISGILAQQRRLHYLFIYLDTDTQSRSIAHLFAQKLKDTSPRCPVCYVNTDRHPKTETSRYNALHPVHINVPVVLDAIEPQLEQMTFNTHLIWKGTWNLDLEEQMETFRNSPYEFTSSLGFVFTIKHKLHSIGLDGTPEELAEQFRTRILDKLADNDIGAAISIAVLSELEHRRWVLEKVTLGWRAPFNEDGTLDLAGCVRKGAVKNIAEKTHPCLVHSTASLPLLGRDYTENNKAKWEDPAISPDLDELDRMSVELHQHFRAAAEQFKQQTPMRIAELIALRRLCEKHDYCVSRAFQQFQFCLKNILSGLESYTLMFDRWKTELLDALRPLPAGDREEAVRLIDEIERKFFAVREANLYRDYKENDTKLIKQIPYILTYRFSPSIAMAFEDGNTQNGRSEAIFQNVASATVLSPKKLLYLYHFTKDSSVEQLAETLSSVLSYLNKRNLRSTVSLALSCEKTVSAQKRSALATALETLRYHVGETMQNAVFAEFCIYDAADSSESIRLLSGHLLRSGTAMYDGSTALYSSAMDNSNFLCWIMEQQLPYFEFDRLHKQFRQCCGCGYLQYIEDHSYLSVNDMFAMMNAVNTRFELPDYSEEYETLWKIYTGSYLKKNKFSYGVANWNRLCSLLSTAARKKELSRFDDNIAEFEKNAEYHYVIPADVFENARMIVNYLIRIGAADSSSAVISNSRESCTVRIIAASKMKTVLKAIFETPERLTVSDAIEISHAKALKKYLVHYYDPTVQNVLLVPDKKKKQTSTEEEGAMPVDVTETEMLRSLLQSLQQQHFIRKLSFPAETETASFCFTSTRFHKLLTNAGAILEIFTYYDVMKTGYFDDIACSYEFSWSEKDVTNEFDLVLTKGFRSIIVECKAVQELEQNFYHKLYSLADQFGIGTTKVLIGNTYLEDGTVTSAKDIHSSVQRLRGQKMRIITYSKQEEIMQIGTLLKHLMEE